MIKAGSLFYAIVISLVIAVLASMFIFFSYYNKINHLSVEQNRKLILNANSGLNLLLSANEYIELNQSKILDLYGDGLDSVKLERRNWGAFEMALSTAFFKNNSFTKAAIIGNNISADTLTALYLVDLDKPLSLCGNTLLKGTCYLPKAGLKRAYIEGQSFSGEKLVSGEVKESSRHLPALNKALISSNLDYLKGKINKNDSVWQVDKFPIPDSLFQPSAAQTLVLKSNNGIALMNNYLSGNVIIVSGESVFVGASTKLEDIIIYAPKIVLEDGFNGSVQLFVSDSLVVGKGCVLNYPSVLALVRSESSSNQISATIGEGTTLKGVIFGHQETSESGKQLRVNLNKETRVIGQVYVNGSLDLKGAVYGNIFCQKFILITPSSVYENHLLNAEIDAQRLPENFTGVNLVNASIKKGIVKWMH